MYVDSRLRSVVLAAVFFGVAAAARADVSWVSLGQGPLASVIDQTSDAPPPAPSSSDSNAWFARVDKAQASQPHWMTPLVTVTPRLEEEFRYDQDWQHLGNGEGVDNYGGGKGLELIPTTTNEVIFNVPPYETRSYVKPADGFGDDTVLLVKQRLRSENEENGNYIVTAFLGITAPTGSDAFTAHSWELTPTIAAGKGTGRSDVQGTFGVTLPASHVGTIGDAFATNIALQYNVAKLWPELEFNDTYWSGGERGGKNQLMMTPGLVVGRYKLGGRFKGTFGLGYQWAVSPTLEKKPALIPTYTDAWVSSFRISF